jgi:hypothetical protein
MRNVIERLAAIRREKIANGYTEFEKVTKPEPEAIARRTGAAKGVIAESVPKRTLRAQA